MKLNLKLPSVWPAHITVCTQMYQRWQEQPCRHKTALTAAQDTTYEY